MSGARRDPEPIAIIMAAALRALAKPPHLAIVQLLGAGPSDIHQVAVQLHMPESAARAHLAQLRAVDLVESIRDGRLVRYRLTDDDVATACDLLRSILVRRITHLADRVSRA